MNEKKNGYATVSDDEGVNYRDIAETMTMMGHKMNHSSARNYVLRVMQKFASAIADMNDVELEGEKLQLVAKSPSFQCGISDILQTIEAKRRDNLFKKRG